MKNKISDATGVSRRPSHPTEFQPLGVPLLDALAWGDVEGTFNELLRRGGLYAVHDSLICDDCRRGIQSAVGDECHWESALGSLAVADCPRCRFVERLFDAFYILVMRSSEYRKAAERNRPSAPARSPQEAINTAREHWMCDDLECEHKRGLVSLWTGECLLCEKAAQRRQLDAIRKRQSRKAEADAQARVEAERKAAAVARSAKSKSKARTDKERKAKDAERKRIARAKKKSNKGE
jgi:glutaredoxin